MNFFHKNIIVTININNLSQRLIDDHIIQPLIAQGVPPAKVLVVPDDAYMDSKGYVKIIDVGGVSTTIYDYVKAVKDEKLQGAIHFISAELTGEGKGLNAIEIGAAQSAIETKDANDEMATGLTKRKLTAAEVLNNRANWDYTIKVNLNEKTFGTQADYTLAMKIVDMYTLTSESVPDLTMRLSSADNREQMVTRLLRGSVAQLSNKIASNYGNKVKSGFNGKAYFYIASNSKGNFNSNITLSSGTSKSMGEIAMSLLKPFILKDKDKQPQIDGQASDLSRAYNNVWIPYEVIVHDEINNTDDPTTNTFEILGYSYKTKAEALIPNLKVTPVFHRGSIELYFSF